MRVQSVAANELLVVRKSVHVVIVVRKKRITSIGFRPTTFGRARDRIPGGVFLDPAKRAVELVIDDRVADVGKMHSNLVLSTGDWFRLDQSMGGEPFNDLKVGQCRA